MTKAQAALLELGKRAIVRSRRVVAGRVFQQGLVAQDGQTWWPLTLSALSSLFCPVIGFVAILMTILARRDYTMKRYESSLIKRTVAYKLSIAAVLVGALIIILVVLFLLKTRFSHYWTSTVEP